MDAEFEVNLRDAWRNEYRRTTRPRMWDLILSISALNKVKEEWRDQVDEVRTYRNSLIHSGLGDERPVPIAQALSRLVRYLSRLPLDW